MYVMIEHVYVHELVSLAASSEWLSHRYDNVYTSCRRVKDPITNIHDIHRSDTA